MSTLQIRILLANVGLVLVALATWSGCKEDPTVVAPHGSVSNWDHGVISVFRDEIVERQMSNPNQRVQAEVALHAAEPFDTLQKICASGKIEIRSVLFQFRNGIAGRVDLQPRTGANCATEFRDLAAKSYVDADQDQEGESSDILNGRFTVYGLYVEGLPVEIMNVWNAIAAVRAIRLGVDWMIPTSTMPISNLR